MKATTIIIAAVLSFQVSILCAGNKETMLPVNNEPVSFNISKLAPVTPVEASFEETTLMNAFIFDFSALALVTPKEADFSDVVPEKNIDLTILAPVTPVEADFTESIESQTIDLSVLAPVTPAVADFD